MSDLRQRQAQAMLRKLPPLPDNWRELTHPQFRLAANNWQWGDGNMSLLGETGRGKSLCANVLLRKLIARGIDGDHWGKARRVAFIEAPALSRATFQDGDSSLMHTAKRASLLVIDELGYLDKNSGTVEEVVDYRDKRVLPMVITSGMTPAELAERYGDATARKLTEPARHKVVQVFASVTARSA